jgi:membrane-bound metal-dependent hydrolase YbcI (DUF457 family)
MDTFSHILIAFLLLGKVDLKLAVFAGIMALILDLDFVLEPFSKKVPILEHRGITHSIPGLIAVTLVATAVFSIITGTHYLLGLGAGLTGAFTHTIGDTLTSYGTGSLWPFVKTHVKLDIILGIDPLTIFVSVTSLPFLYSSYKHSNIQLFNTVYLIAAIFFGSYFLIRMVLKAVIHFKFHTVSLPMFNWFKFKIIYTTHYTQEGQEYGELKWQIYNLITGHFSPEKRFTYALMEPVPPLDTDEKMIAYSHKIATTRRMLAHSKYHVGELLSRNADGGVIFWYALELEAGKYRMGVTVHLKRDGTYQIKSVYPYPKRH